MNVHLGGNHAFSSFLRIFTQNDPSENRFHFEIEVKFQNPLYESTFQRFVCVTPNHTKFFEIPDDMLELLHLDICTFSDAP